VWSTFGTAEGFLVEVEEWTNQSELFSIAAAESATDAGNYSTAAAGYRAQALTYANNAGDSASAAAVSATAAMRCPWDLRGKFTQFMVTPFNSPPRLGT